jgi:hypothetical protein
MPLAVVTVVEGGANMNCSAGVGTDYSLQHRAPAVLPCKIMSQSAWRMQQLLHTQSLRVAKVTHKWHKLIGHSAKGPCEHVCQPVMFK